MTGRSRELMTGLEISQAAVSQHLRVLREAGLVRRSGLGGTSATGCARPA